MKNRTICLVFALLVFRHYGYPQWVQTNGPSVNRAVCFAVSSARIYAGIWGRGLYVSDDAGGTWTALGNDARVRDVRALLVNGPDLLCGTGGGLFLSSDNSTTWSEADSGLSSSAVNCLAGNGADLFAGTFSRGVFVSTNGGFVWRDVNGGIASYSGYFPTVQCMAFHRSNLIAGGNWAGRIYLFNGAFWTGIALPEGTWVNTLASVGMNLFVGTEYGGIYLTTDQGTSWTALNSGLTSKNVRCFAAKETSLFAGTYGGGVFISTNNGANWTSRNTGLDGRFVWSLAFVNSYLLAGTDDGIHRSSNDGLTWYKAGLEGNLNVGITALAVGGSDVYAGAGLTFGTPKDGLYRDFFIFHSTDNGQSWVRQAAGLAHAIVLRPADVLVGTESGVLRSTDHGTTWAATNEGLPKDRNDPTKYLSVTCLASSGQNLYAGTNWSGIYLSTNNGLSWTAVTEGLPKDPADSTWFYKIMCIVTRGQDVVAGISGFGAFHSSDNGMSWEAANAGLTNHEVSALAVCGADLFAATGEGMFRSTNGGTSWTPLNSNWSVLSLAVSGSAIIAGTSGNAILLSTNNGTSWTSIDTDLPEAALFIGLNESHVFAGLAGERGVWKRPLSEIITSSGAMPNQIPSACGLYQNYPNPFNPSTTIKFELPRALQVSLSVFDILGRQVSVLVNDRRNAGIHEVKFDASSLPSGVYFYRLYAGSYAETKKLLLVR